jgi:phosphate uptake regulator
MKKDLEEEIEILDDMIDALVELLEEKGLITTEEWEAKIKEKIGA